MNTDAQKRDQNKPIPRIIARWAVRETMGVVMMAVILFLAAGRWDWGWGWVLVAVMAAWVVATGIAVIPRHPQLLADRVGPKSDAKKWDVGLMGVVGLLTLVGYVVAGLDARNGWTADLPDAVRIPALIVTAAGYAAAVWATASNAFFSQIMRIQADRGHTVAVGGPYRFLRHPAYLGQVAVNLAAPLVLGSWPAFAVGAVLAGLIVVRTALEDRTLLAELPGYKDYAARVRHRLLPGVW
ncbi:MAG: isoprenylcysteine carboxylmethyltransferase family protein [Anaerolineales bacterium]|nr:isoprenylcysteine carboxylmethyltransferase family protein [Anaerolineales bacterium]